MSDGSAQARAAGSVLLPQGFLAVGLIVLAAVLVAPLAAYVFMIALFGLPHVLCELRYCDERFSARAPRKALYGIGALLVLLTVARLAQALQFVPASVAVPVELGVGAALTIVAVRFMREHKIWGALAGLGLTLGIVFAPIETFLLTAWLHNLTPLGFAAEILPGQERRRGLLFLAVPFLLLPAVVASGLPHQALQMLTAHDAGAAPSLFDAGRTPYAAFLTSQLARGDAVPLFSAAVTAQAMHYFAVIVVLPRLLARYGRNHTAPTLVAWPSWTNFYWATAAAAVVVFAAHGLNYANARAFYGIAAAIHSWIELPLFLLALGAGLTSVRKEAHQAPSLQRSPAPTG